MIYKNNYSTGTKLLAAFRFLVLKVIFYKRLKTGTVGLVGRGIYFHIRKGGEMSLGNRPVFSDYIELLALGKIAIGNNLTINRYSRIVAHNEITIGNNVTIAQFVTILDHDHNYKFEDNKLSLDGYTTAPVFIGDNVWIGDKVTILKGVKIGNNVIIGANSVINKDVPDNSIAGGVPFKLLKKLDG